MEYWIFRVDAWDKTAVFNDRYVHVLYQIYERGLSDDEINRKLSIRLTKIEEKICEKSVLTGAYPDGTGWARRPVTVADLVKTKFGKSEDIGEFRQFPCFAVSDLPKVVEP